MQVNLARSASAGYRRIHARDEVSEWLQAFRLAWSVYLPVRVLLSLTYIVVFLTFIAPRAPAPSSFFGWIDALLIEPWNRWDVEWYLKITHDGYGIADGRGAFHPLLPLLMRLLGDLLGGQYVLAGIVVSNIACLVLLATLYRLIAQDHGQDVAHRSIMWVLRTPISFVLLIPYTESLLLCFALLAFWFARRERWLAAGICGCLAALAKQPGVLLVLPLFWEYVSRHRDRLLSWRSAGVVANLSLIPLGYLTFALCRTLSLGEASFSQPAALISSLLVSKQLGQTWDTRFGWPWEWLANVVAFLPRAEGAIGRLFWIEMVVATLQLGILGLALRRARAWARIWSVLQVAMGLTLVLAIDPLLSLPRRIMLAFPIYVQLAVWSTGARGRIMLNIGLLLMLTLAMLYTGKFFVP